MIIVTQGYLQIDDTLVKGKSVEGLLTLDVAPRVYLGGLPDMSEVMERSGAGPEAEASLARYRGCMRSLYINEASYPLKVIRGRTGANIQDCDGTVCGGEVSDTYRVFQKKTLCVQRSITQFWKHLLHIRKSIGAMQ